MSNIHCHHCGGFINEPAAISYRRLVDGTVRAAPHSAFCSCDHAVLYGAPPGRNSEDFVSRRASRN